VALSPAPSVAHLDALLARRSHADARLAVSGDPRALPASVELSAYRVVEHLLGVLADEPETRIDVLMRFEDDALEITVTGPVLRGADVRGTVARARERVRLQQGSLNVKVARGRARAVAQMPFVTA
jgi:signal transduction histidine kinase